MSDTRQALVCCPHIDATLVTMIVNVVAASAVPAEPLTVVAPLAKVVRPKLSFNGSALTVSVADAVVEAASLFPPLLLEAMPPPAA